MIEISNLLSISSTFKHIGIAGLIILLPILIYQFSKQKNKGLKIVVTLCILFALAVAGIVIFFTVIFLGPPYR